MIRSTPRIEALPATTPFVGPEALARRSGIAEDALLRLGANESCFGASRLVYATMERELPRISLYGDPELFVLREALAARLGVTRERLLVASGIDDLIGLFVRAYGGAGGRAVTTAGTYPTVFYHLAAYGVAVETAPYAGTRPDLAALIELAHVHRAALVYLANPDNPGGGFYDAAALSAFIDALPADAALLLDEAYAEYAPADASPLADRPNVIRMRTFSKAYGLAGLRVGYAIADATVIATMEKIRQHFGVSRLSAAAATAALDDSTFVANVVAQTVDGRDEYAALARSIGLTTYPSYTNFVLFECGAIERATALVAALLELGIFIRKPGSGALASCVRITVGGERERRRLAAVLPAALAACDARNGRR